MPRKLACSFCEKGADDVQRLLAGSRAYICDGCVGACNNILAQHPPGEAMGALTRSARPWWRRLAGLRDTRRLRLAAQAS